MAIVAAAFASSAKLPAQAPAVNDGPDHVLVTVGDVPIKQSDMQAFLRRTRPGGLPTDGQQNPVEIAAAIERLVDERLLRDAIARERVVVDATAVTAAIERLRKQVLDTSGMSLDAALKRSGSDEATLRQQIEFEMAVSKLISPRVDAAALAAVFDKHRRDIDGTRVRVSHIVLRPDVGRGAAAMTASLGKAAEIRAAIAGGDVGFAEAAARHSVGPSRHRGGDLGFLPRRGEIDETFAREAFALDVGDVSQPFATSFGVHLVTVTAIEPGTATLDMLRPQVERLAAQEATRQLIAELRRATPITYSPGVSRLGTITPGGDSPASPAAATGPVQNQ